MSLLRRALILVKSNEPVKAKLGHLRYMQLRDAERAAGQVMPPMTPSDHGPTPATIDESDTK